MEHCIQWWCAATRAQCVRYFRAARADAGSWEEVSRRLIDAFRSSLSPWLGALSLLFPAACFTPYVWSVPPFSVLIISRRQVRNAGLVLQTGCCCTLACSALCVAALRVAGLVVAGLVIPADMRRRYAKVCELPLTAIAFSLQSQLL